MTTHLNQEKNHGRAIRLGKTKTLKKKEHMSGLCRPEKTSSKQRLIGSRCETETIANADFKLVLIFFLKKHIYCY